MRIMFYFKSWMTGCWNVCIINKISLTTSLTIVVQHGNPKRKIKLTALKKQDISIEFSCLFKAIMKPHRTYQLLK